MTAPKIIDRSADYGERPWCDDCEVPAQGKGLMHRWYCGGCLRSIDPDRPESGFLAPDTDSLNRSGMEMLAEMARA